MRILWISHSSQLDGAERSLLEAIEGLISKNIEIEVILPAKGPLYKKLKNLTDSIYIVPQVWWIGKSLNPIFHISLFNQIFRSALEIKKILEKSKPNIAITNTLVIPSGALAARLSKIPHIWYIREYVEEDHKMKFAFGRKASLSFVKNFSKKIIANSNAVLKRFETELGSEKLKKVYNAVEMPAFSDEKIPLKKDTFYLTLVGRKSPGKGQLEAIKAVDILTKKGLEIHLWLIGGGNPAYINELQKTARALNIEEKVEFISFVENPFSYMLSADGVLVCSENEAFGRVTVEAMKLGKPVIASDRGANTELIENVQNGLIYKYSDPKSLADKIQYLYENPELKKVLGTNAESWAKSNFNLEKYSSDLINVFEQNL